MMKGKVYLCKPGCRGIKGRWLLLAAVACVFFATLGFVGCDAGAYHRREESEFMKMTMTVGTAEFKVHLFPCAATEDLLDMLPLTLEMSDVNGNEKYASLPEDVPTKEEKPGSVHTGDLMLWDSGGLVLFYETFATPYRYTRIGRVDDVDGLKFALGSGRVTVVFSLHNKEDDE